MTTPHTHLDDDALSEIVDALSLDAIRDGDGVGDVADGNDRVGDCAECADRLAGFLAVRVAVARPVSPLDPQMADAIIGNALTAAEGRDRSGVITPLRPRRVTTPPATWLIAAAAVFLLVLAVPAILQRTSEDRESLATSSADRAAGSAEAFGAPDAALPATGGGATGEATQESASDTADAFTTPAPPSLGAVDDPDELVRRLIEILSTTSEKAQNSGSASTTAPACEDEARSIGAGRLGGLSYAGPVVWRGQDATTLVFQLTEPSAGDTRQAYVMSTEGCSLLADPRF